jgi:hypothetical protein
VPPQAVTAEEASGNVDFCETLRPGDFATWSKEYPWQRGHIAIFYKGTLLGSIPTDVSNYHSYIIF